MFHGRPWECCHISPKGGGKEQKEQSESHLMKQVYSKQKLPLVVSRPNGSHSRFGHYFCSNIYGRTPRGPRGVKKSDLFFLQIILLSFCANIALGRHKLRKIIKIGKKCQKNLVFLEYFKYSSIWGQY